MPRRKKKAPSGLYVFFLLMSYSFACIALGASLTFFFTGVPSAKVEIMQRTTELHVNAPYAMKVGSTDIFADTEGNLQLVSAYFAVARPDLDARNISIPVVSYVSDSFCNGQIDDNNQIIFTGCNQSVLRNTVLNQTTWMPFVLYHELGHAVLNTSSQCLADTYAERLMRESLGMALKHGPRPCGDDP